MYFIFEYHKLMYLAHLWLCTTLVCCMTKKHDTNLQMYNPYQVYSATVHYSLNGKCIQC